MKARDIMTADPAFCTPNSPLREVARQMQTHDCGEIPIVDNEEDLKVVGVVTDRDIVMRAVAKGLQGDTHVGEIMTRDVVAVQEDAGLEECLNKMEERQVRRIPVLDSQGALCGIVAQADIAMHANKSTTGDVVRDISRPH